MRHLPKAWNATIITFCAVVITLSGLLAAPASAAPQAATGCNGVVCMHVTTPSSDGSFTINSWDRYSANCFYGHYQMGRAGTNIFVNSPTENWCHTNNFYHTFNLSQGSGAWCVIGWKKQGSGYVDVGQPCETVT